jgi:hypothetical protein
MLNNKILCVGNRSKDTNDQCREIAKKYNIAFRGLITKCKDIVDGCYSTSLADMPDYELINVKKYFDIIIFLDNYEDNITLEKGTRCLKNAIVGNDIVLKTLPPENILYVGCSHTAGVGHSNPKTTFPLIFSELQNKSSQVRGNPGQGNYVIEDVLSEYSLQNQNVIVQFTDIFRLRYFNDATNFVTHKSGGDYTRAEIEVFKESRLTWEFERIVDRTVARLRDANVKFLFFQLSHVHSLSNDVNIYMSKFKEFCYLPSNTFVDRAEDKLHFGIKTNQNIAYLLNQKWNLIYA